MKKFKFTIRGNNYDVEVKDFEKNIGIIDVNGSEYEVEVHQEEVKHSKTPTLTRSSVPISRKDSKIKKTVSSRAIQLIAPLPGNIFKILKKEGDTVKKGETILIMEAMKMENNIDAEKDGVIKNMKVGEGDAVLQNDVLAEIE
ncbi:MAG: acetyl-CoA carboxylase biotin carboxyl carrier protein subunit [Bacteroidales bacterium]|jgi:biotin carboxyl carrier protein|nr:acetyl-CoA carboxylase biotin carboxyl carrier protein subunit [Bacteroidales bacterium]